MANITKRVNNKTADLLGGESAEIAILVEPKGTYSGGMLLLDLAPQAETRRAESAAAGADGAEGGVAATVPAASAIVAVTPTRLVAIESNGLTFKNLDFETPRAAVRATALENKGLGKRITLGFSDDTSVVVDANRGQPHARFAEALGGQIS
ncbi:MAG: hypothetical protein P8N02_04090 [Actinomycetota bacterium]|nr:hypothetical protein [Actinomycetota bacterium]